RQPLRPDLAAAHDHRPRRARQPARSGDRGSDHAHIGGHHLGAHLARLGELRLLPDPHSCPAGAPAGPLRRSGARKDMSLARSPHAWKMAGLVAVLAIALLLPVIAPDPATTNVAVFTVMYVGLATAWNIMGGYTGYISLGHAGFFGFGAYGLGLMLVHLNITPGYGPFVLVPVAGLLSALLAVGMR